MALEKVIEKLSVDRWGECSLCGKAVITISVPASDDGCSCTTWVCRECLGELDDILCDKADDGE